MLWFYAVWQRFPQQPEPKRNSSAETDFCTITGMGSENLSEKSMVASSWHHLLRKSFLLIGIWLSLSGSVFSGGLSEVDSSQVLEMLKRGVPVIDIRRQDEWIETGVIEGSRLMTAFDQNGVLTPGFPERFTGLIKKDEEVLLICHSGSRTYYIGQALSQQLGYQKVFHANRGIVHWLRKGYPLVEADLKSAL